MKGVTLKRNTYWLRMRIDGKLIQRSLGTSDEAEAIRLAREILAGREERVVSMPWETALNRFLDHKKEMGNSRAHLQMQRTIMGRAAREMQWESPIDATPAGIATWMQFRKNPRTRIQYLEIMSRFFRWMVEKRMVASNPCDGIERPRKVPKAVRKRFLTPDEADRLIGTPCGDDLKFAIFCGLHAGLRKGEICAARPEWFDLDRGLLHVTADAEWHAKDGDNRTIPLSRQFREFLAGYGLRSPFMLRPEKKQGRYIYRADLRVPFEKHLNACGIDCHFHDLRRTFASLHVSAGVSIYKVAMWLGDAVAVVQAHYGHLFHDHTDIERAWERTTKTTDPAP